LGVQRQSGVFEAEDHASPLCETMALICSRQKTITIETQQRFFNSNIGGWMPQFFQDMQQASSARFYRAVGTLGEAFLILEKQYLNL
jgi:TorA maturation chaperone TorD